MYKKIIMNTIERTLNTHATCDKIKIGIALFLMVSLAHLVDYTLRCNYMKTNYHCSINNLSD